MGKDSDKSQRERRAPKDKDERTPAEKAGRTRPKKEKENRLQKLDHARMQAQTDAMDLNREYHEQVDKPAKKIEGEVRKVLGEDKWAMKIHKASIKEDKVSAAYWAEKAAEKEREMKDLKEGGPAYAEAKESLLFDKAQAGQLTKDAERQEKMTKKEVLEAFKNN